MLLWEGSELRSENGKILLVCGMNPPCSHHHCSAVYWAHREKQIVVPNWLWWCFPQGAAFLYSSAPALSRGWGHSAQKSLRCCVAFQTPLNTGFPRAFFLIFPSAILLLTFFIIQHSKLLNFKIKQKYKASKWAKNFPRLHCQAQSLWKHLKVNLII